MDTAAELPRLALSVRQPWAYALAIGWKPVENRSWRGGNPGLNFRGEFCIHASKGMTRDEYDDAAMTFAWNNVVCPPAAELQRGGIIGRAVLVDVVSDHPSGWFAGPKGLVIANASPVPFIPVGGQLGFFDWRVLLPFTPRGTPPDPPAKWMLPDAPATVRQPKAAPQLQGKLL